jgi:hypothetical protein
MVAMSIADVLMLVELFGIQRMSCWQCCCSCLQHGGIEAKAFVGEHFGVCCAFCSLQHFFEMYMQASVLILTSSQNFQGGNNGPARQQCCYDSKPSSCVEHDWYAGDVHHLAYCGSGIVLSKMFLCITINCTQRKPIWLIVLTFFSMSWQESKN